MEKLKRSIEQSRKALKTLHAILNEPYSIIVRDATIQRFEYTFEVFWKTLKNYLTTYEGIQCNSPKSCFREAFKTGLLNEQDTLKLLEMTDDTNLTTHTYIETLADRIYKKIPDYYALMYKVIQLIIQRIENNGLKGEESFTS